MSKINRRDFIRISGLSAATAAAGLPSMMKTADAGTPSYRVVVIGGGFAGATAARYLKLFSKAEGILVHVTLIDRNALYSSPILSNLVLVGALSKAKIDFSYSSLGVDSVMAAEVSAIDRDSKKVTAGGTDYYYDRLIIAPGIDYDYTNYVQPTDTGLATWLNQEITGLSAAISSGGIIPAWKGGVDVDNLRNKQLSVMPTSTGTFILTIPPAPYRCPPGPYERACVVADYLKSVKRGGKVIVLDGNPAIQAEAKTFTAAFASLGVTYVPNAKLVGVAKANGLWTAQLAAPVTFKFAGTSTSVTQTAFTGNVLNVLPRQRAGQVLQLSGISGIIEAGKRFALVHGLTYESKIDTYQGIHIIGDAQYTQPDSSIPAQPKAGHIGNGQGKVCAEAVLGMLKSGCANTSEYINYLLSTAGSNVIAPVVTNSACYSPIKARSAKTASYLSVGYRTDQNWIPRKIDVTGIDSSMGEAPSPSSDNFGDMYDWAENLFFDTFGVTRNIG